MFIFVFNNSKYNTTNPLLGICTILTYVSDFEGLTIKLFLESPELL